MLNNSLSKTVLAIPLIAALSLVVGLVISFLGSSEPFFAIAGLAALLVSLSLVFKFEITILSLLIVRSSLDIFSEQQLPAIFAVALDLVAVLYLAILILLKKPIKIDGLFLFFGGWIALQFVWILLIPLGGLGPSPVSISDALREWIRMASWLVIYLLISQLRDKIRPEKVLKILFLSLAAPLTAGLLQAILPPSLLPSFLLFTNTGVGFEIGSRVNGTLGHPATFASFLVLFIGLTLWQILASHQKLGWTILLLILIFFLVTTKALTGLVMFGAFLIVFIVPRLNVANALGAILLSATLLLLFASTEFGRERLASIGDTPLLNSDMDLSRAVLMGQWDGNSFNWRLTQWTFLLQAWAKHPFLGYGLATASSLTIYQNYAHNDYVRALVEGGVVGFVLFLLLLGGVALRLALIASNKKLPANQRSLGLTVLAIWMSLATGMLTDNIWTHTTLFFYFWLLASVVSWDWTLTPQKTTAQVLQPVP